MKKVLSLIAGLMLVATVLIAVDRSNPPLEMTVGTNSLMIAPPRVNVAKNWVAGTGYRNGDLVRSTTDTSRVYWNMTSLTNLTVAVTEPVHAWSFALDNVTNIWQRVSPEPRKGIIIGNDGPGVGWFALNNVAVTNKGIVLTAGGSFALDASFQGFVDCVGTSTIHTTIQEW